MGRATEDLRREHESILHAFKIYDNIMSSDSREDNVFLKYYGQLIYFLKIFVDKCHHGKEEGYLFKRLAVKGKPNEDEIVNNLLEEHKLAREYISMMSDALVKKDIPELKNYALKYRDLLRSHIDKENNGIFMIADELLNDSEQDMLYEKFEAHEENVIGHGVHEELHAMIKKWEELT